MDGHLCLVCLDKWFILKSFNLFHREHIHVGPKTSFVKYKINNTTLSRNITSCLTTN